MIFVWVRQKFRDDGRTGINQCQIFRNESARLSSEIILEAEQLAVQKWGSSLAFTFIDPGKLRTSKRRGREFCHWPPGRCFVEAGWKFFQKTDAGLHILVKPITPL